MIVDEKGNPVLSKKAKFRARVKTIRQNFKAIALIVVSVIGVVAVVLSNITNIGSSVLKVFHRKPLHVLACSEIVSAESNGYVYDAAGNVEIFRSVPIRYENDSYVLVTNKSGKPYTDVTITVKAESNLYDPNFDFVLASHLHTSSISAPDIFKLSHRNEFSRIKADIFHHGDTVMLHNRYSAPIDFKIEFRAKEDVRTWTFPKGCSNKKSFTSRIQGERVESFVAPECHEVQSGKYGKLTNCRVISGSAAIHMYDFIESQAPKKTRIEFVVNNSIVPFKAYSPDQGITENK